MPVINPAVRRLLAASVPAIQALGFKIVQFTKSPPLLDLSYLSLRLAIGETGITSRFNMPESYFNQPQVPGFADAKLPASPSELLQTVKQLRDNFVQILQLQQRVEYHGAKINNLVSKMKRLGMQDENERRQKFGPAENLQSHNPINLRPVDPANAREIIHEVTAGRSKSAKDNSFKTKSLKDNPTQRVQQAIANLSYWQRLQPHVQALDRLGSGRFLATIELTSKGPREITLTPRQLRLAGTELARKLSASVEYCGSVLTPPDRRRISRSLQRYRLQFPTTSDIH